MHADVTPRTTGVVDPTSRPHGCYWKANNAANDRLWFNPNGNRSDDDIVRVSICGKPLFNSPEPVPDQCLTTSPGSPVHRYHAIR